jgi:endonuclease YncB( thermonuclease family)
MRPSPCGWPEAREYLQQGLPIGQQVRLDVKTTDRYGRTVAEDGQAFV